MNPIKIEATEFSPRVLLDSQNQRFEIEGESRPENTGKFYAPILEWLVQYKEVLFWQKDKYGKAPKMAFEFKLDYFNSTSAKFIMDIFFVLEKYYKENYEVEIKWHYDAPDEDMKESGEEFAKMVKTPVLFVKK